MTNQANITSGPSILGDALLGAIRQVVREEIKAAMAGRGSSYRPKRLAKPYLNVKGAAEVACLAPSTIRLYIRRGELKAHKVGRRVIIERADLESFLRMNPTGILLN